jgi:hypothetical protein
MDTPNKVATPRIASLVWYIQLCEDMPPKANETVGQFRARAFNAELASGKDLMENIDHLPSQWGAIKTRDEAIAEFKGFCASIQ